MLSFLILSYLFLPSIILSSAITQLTQVGPLVMPYKQNVGRPSTAEHQRDEPWVFMKPWALAGSPDPPVQRLLVRWRRCVPNWPKRPSRRQEIMDRWEAVLRRVIDRAIALREIHFSAQPVERP